MRRPLLRCPIVAEIYLYGPKIEFIISRPHPVAAAHS